MAPRRGPNGSVRFELRELNTVSVDGNSFNGPYDQKFFDANGNLVAEDKGVIHSTRLTVADYQGRADELVDTRASSVVTRDEEALDRSAA